MIPQRLAIQLMAMMLCALVGTSACATRLDPAKLAGDWLAPAEDADDVDAIITLSIDNGTWHGHIKTIQQTRPDQKMRDSTPCNACSGIRHGQLLKGLEVIWGLRETDGVLQSGQILDPGDGAIYSCEMRLSSDGKRLEVLAYKGMRWLGHTMTWLRP